MEKKWKINWKLPYIGLHKEYMSYSLNTVKGEYAGGDIGYSSRAYDRGC